MNADYIGTEMCTSGVGVYFQVGSSACFCAHIKIVNKNPDKVEKVADVIAHRFMLEAVKGGWRKEGANRHTVKIVCVNPGAPEAMVEAGIRKFLDLPPTLDRLLPGIDKKHHDFIRKPALGIQYPDTCTIDSFPDKATKDLAWKPKLNTPGEMMSSVPGKPGVVRPYSHPILQADAWTYTVGEKWVNFTW